MLLDYKKCKISFPLNFAKATTTEHSISTQIQPCAFLLFTLSLVSLYMPSVVQAFPTEYVIPFSLRNSLNIYIYPSFTFTSSQAGIY